jgi:hypothetical protein
MCLQKSQQFVYPRVGAKMINVSFENIENFSKVWHQWQPLRPERACIHMMGLLHHQILQIQQFLDDTTSRSNNWQSKFTCHNSCLFVATRTDRMVWWRKSLILSLTYLIDLQLVAVASNCDEWGFFAICLMQFAVSLPRCLVFVLLVILESRFPTTTVSAAPQQFVAKLDVVFTHIIQISNDLCDVSLRNLNFKNNNI